MFKGERGFFVLVLICLLVAGAAWMKMRPDFPVLPTDQYQEAEETKYSPGSPVCFPSRLDKLPDEEAPDERYRCETQAEKHRLQSNDLVQQTRAADAAEKIVGLTYNQTVIGLAVAIIGLLTLLAAAFAAWFARSAATHTETGALEARNAAQAAAAANVLNENSVKRQQRAYVTVKPNGISNLLGTNTVIGQVLMENVGATPAYNVSLQVEMHIEPEDDWQAFEPRGDPGNRQCTLQPRAEMAKGSAKSWNGTYHLAKDTIAPDKYIFVWGIAWYEDIFGDRHFTEFCHRYSSGSYERPAFKAISGRTLKRLYLFLPELARFHLFGNDTDREDGG